MIVETEVGGRQYAESRLMQFMVGYEHPIKVALLARVTGLPDVMVLQLLFDLKARNHVQRSRTGTHWRINVEAFQ